MLAKSYAQQLGRDWSGLVNGVLRNLTRVPAPSFPDQVSHPAESLSVRYGIPEWLTERWLSRMGFDQAELACRASSTVPSITLRVNSNRVARKEFLQRLRQAGVTAHATTVSPVGVVLEKGQDVTSLPGFQAGDFFL
jgi:16S rRNA (cytosine967-C5)-methyltransferase